MGTGTDHRTLVGLAYIVWTFDGSQPSHSPVITHSWSAWECFRGTSMTVSHLLSLYALHACGEGLKRLHAVPTMLSPTPVLAADRWVRCFVGSRFSPVGMRALRLCAFCGSRTPEMGHPRARFDELTEAGGGANPQLVADSSQLI